MRLALLSDTHEQHDKFIIPECDVFIHAGDFTMNGRIDKIQEFNKWLSKVPAQHKLVIPGNHEVGWDAAGVFALQEQISNAYVLVDSGITLNTIRFHGIPWTPTFGYGWAFNANPEKMKSVCDLIPNDVDVIISHGPPKAILDETLGGDFVGSPELLSIIHRIKPKLVVFGHIHEAYGTQEAEGTAYANVSAVDFSYQPRPDPVVIFNL